MIRNMNNNIILNNYLNVIILMNSAIGNKKHYVSQEYLGRQYIIK